MDFIPIIKEVTVTAATPFDVSDYIEKGKSGVMFYAETTLTLSDGTNTIDVLLGAYEPLRLPESCTTLTSSETTTMVCGAFDNPAYS